MKKDIVNDTFNKHTFLLKKRLYEQGVIQQKPIQEVELEEGLVAKKLKEIDIKP